MPGLVGWDAEFDKLASDVLGGYRTAGDSAWEEPAVVERSVGGVDSVCELLSDEHAQGFGHLDRGFAECDEHRASLWRGYLLGAEVVGSGEGLREEQDEEADDAGVKPDRVVAQEGADMTPAVGISHRDMRLAGVRVLHGDTVVDPSAVYPSDERVQHHRH